MKPLRILIVDDSTLARKIINDALSPLSEVEIAGMASNGKDALSRVESLHPDIVTLDVEMPDMNGLEVLSELQNKGFPGSVIMVSNYTKTGAPFTIRALELGAFDFILKPSFSSLEINKTALREMFLPRLQVLSQRKQLSQLLQGSSPPKILTKRVISSHQSVISTRENRFTATPQIVAIGVSTGGPQALSQILPKLPENLSVPVVVVQHMPELFTYEFAKSLDAKCHLTVKEAKDGEVLLPGTVYIAPGGRQMKICQTVSGKIVQITDDPTENNCKPSVDYCFSSVANLYGKNAIAVILTGMGKDGAVGAQLMKRRGAKIIAQDKATSIVFGMPKAVIDAGIADRICPLPKIAAEICRNFSEY